MSELELELTLWRRRWIRLLFGREFPFDDVLAVWDLVIAENVRASLIDMICVSMLLRIRWQCKYWLWLHQLHQLRC